MPSRAGVSPPGTPPLQAGRRIAAISVGINLLLATSALWAGWAGGSTTVLAAGVEFSADVVASLVVMAGFWYASKPADWNHPYGHGRAETLTGLLVGLGLVLVGAAIVTRGFMDIGAGGHLVPAHFTVWPLVASLVVKSGLMTTKWRLARRFGSQALMADAWNDSVDVLSSLAALVALGLALYDPTRFAAADAVGAVLVGAFVITAGVGVVRSTSLDLIDTMPPASVIDKVRVAALGVPGVRGVEKCFGRKTGLQYHVDLHLEVDGWITVDEGHAIAAQTRDAVRDRVPEVTDVLVHVEPHVGAAS